MFNTTPQHPDAFVPSWHEFKNSDAVEIGILHSQPLTNNHFPLFILVASASSLSRVASAAQTNDSPPLSAISPSIVSLMCWVERCHHVYGCPIGHFVTTCTISWLPPLPPQKNTHTHTHTTHTHAHIHTHTHTHCTAQHCTGLLNLHTVSVLDTKHCNANYGITENAEGRPNTSQSAHLMNY